MKGLLEKELGAVKAFEKRCTKEISNASVFCPRLLMGVFSGEMPLYLKLHRRIFMPWIFSLTMIGKQVIRYRNLDMSNFHFRLWT